MDDAAPHGGPAAPRPWPLVSGLHRARVLDLLCRPSRLVLVVAPAGYGKTTLLAQDVARRPGPVVWLRATREDTDPGHLRSSLCRALLRSGIPCTGADGSLEIAEELRAAARGGLTLVVDDEHLLVDSAGERELERLLGDGPPGLTVLLATRRTPGMNLCRAELGPLHVVTAEDLRFRSWEAEDLFRDVYREPLPPDDVAALTRRTDGWAAGLQLFHLSTQSRPLGERRRAVAALAGGPRFARTYLARTVLDELPPELLEFLVRTSVFEVLTADRCDRLLRSTGSANHLDELERRGALTSSDDGGCTYRYHEVLRRHLETTLRERLGSTEAARWHLWAASILEEDDAPGEAVRACLRADAWDRVSVLLRAAGRRAIDAGPGPLWDDVLAPDLVDEDPWLSTAVARRLASDGRLAAATARYRHAEQLFPDPVDRERTARERRLVELWTGALPQPHLHWLDRVRSAVDRGPGLHADAPGPEPGDRLAAAVCTLLLGNAADARHQLQQLMAPGGDDCAGAASAAPGLLPLAGRLVHALAALTTGASVAAEADRIAADAERLGAGWFVRQARVLRALSIGDLTEPARISVDCSGAGDAWGALLADGAAAAGHLLAGSAQTEDFLDLARRCAGLRAGVLGAWAMVGAALTAAARSEPGAAATARAAESATRAAGVWAAEALVSLAACAGAPDRDAALARAQQSAEARGLPWPERFARRMTPAAADSGAARHADPSGVPPGHAPAGRVASRVVEPAAGPVVLRCLGGFEVRLQDRAVDWSALRPRAASALRLLAAHTPRAVHRETLLGLWPGLPEEQATHSLQVAVSSLRCLLVPDAPRGSPRMIDRRGDTYALALPRGSDVDVLAFDAALTAADQARQAGRRGPELAALGRAVGLYRGELLPEDGAAEWVAGMRDRARFRAAGACARLAAMQLAGGEPEASVGTARRGIDIDLYADESWRVLIHAYHRLGDSAAAARARRQYGEVLHELGVSDLATERPGAG